MIYYFVVYVIFILLVAFLTLSVALGQMFGKMRLKAHPEKKLEIDAVSESAVFGLLALLIAFSFSGAYERLEHRKMHLLKEANVYSTAYEYADLLSSPYNKELHSGIQKYLDLHMLAYAQAPYLDQVNQTLAKADLLEQKVWNTAMAGCEANSNKSLFILVIPAINEMFRTSHTGIYMSLVHPPLMVFVLLIGLSATGGFLIGYNSAANNRRRAVHTMCYVLFTAFTIYIIVNIEYPRAGFVRLNFFDQVLIDIKNDMNEPNLISH